MTEDSVPAVSPEKVSIHIVKAKGLTSSKGHALSTIVKVEFGSLQLGESTKVELDPATGFIVFDFSCFLSVQTNDPSVLDELVQTPIVLTVVEVLPKDKKAKEEKTVVLGQCCIDLLPLFRGELSFTVIDILHPTGTTAHPDNDYMPEIEVAISTERSILNEDQRNTCNMLTLCIESLYSLPEEWNSRGEQYQYLTAMSIPMSTEKETLILTPAGVFRAAGEQELNKQRKWSCVPNASGSCIFIPNTSITNSCYSDEDGDFRSKEDVSFREEAERDKSHVTWNAERRCFLTTQASINLQQVIAQYRYWPFEIIRIASQTAVKGKQGGEELCTYHGIAYVDLAPLLYPGVSRVHGAYMVHPYSEPEMMGRFQRRSIITDEVVRNVSGVRSSSSLGKATIPGATKATAVGSNKQGEMKKNSAVQLKTDAPAESDIVTESDTLGQQYVEARSYVKLEFELEKPLVQKKEKEAIIARVAELIPPRPLFPKKSGGAKKAISDFENQIGEISNLLLDEFRMMYGDQMTQSPQDAEERRRHFLFELNTSGKYFAFKEQLKYYIVKLVREKFVYTKKFESREQLQSFISELYPFLLDYMHTGLNKFLTTEEFVEVPPSLTDNKTLYAFAKEAEIMFRYDLAAAYYQERISRARLDASCWLDYGTFCLLIGDLQKADECLRELVALEQCSRDGLLLNGYMRMLNQEYTTAEEFFEAATSIHDQDMLAWVLLGLFQSGVDNIILAERSFNEANKLLNVELQSSNTSRQEAINISVGGEVDVGDAHIRLQSNNVELDVNNSSENICNDDAQDISEKLSEMTVDKEEIPQREKDSIFLRAAQFCLDRHITQLAERALAHELLAEERGEAHHYQQLLAQLHIEQKQYPQALQCLHDAIALKHENPDAWALKGHVFYMTSEFKDAKECYERCLAYVSSASELSTIYIRLATIYLDKDEQFTKSKNMFLKASNLSPSCVTWLGVGVSCYRMDELSEAEFALYEANILDNKNPEVWAYLALVCLKKKRHLEAEQCFKCSIQAGLENEDLKTELKETMFLTDFDMSIL